MRTALLYWSTAYIGSSGPTKQTTRTCPRSGFGRVGACDRKISERTKYIAFVAEKSHMNSAAPLNRQCSMPKECNAPQNTIPNVIYPYKGSNAFAHVPTPNKFLEHIKTRDNVKRESP